MIIKKALAIALTMCMGASVLGMGAISASAESFTGRWKFSDVAAVNVTESEKDALAEALENGYDGLSKFEATDVIAVKVVSGFDYAYLCKETPAGEDAPTNWSIVTIYCDTEGNIVKMFDDASAFVNGKAFVVEGDTVYLIDSSFTKISSIPPISM